MEKIMLAILIQLIMLNCGNAQTFQVDTLQYNGDINKYINLVIIGDGYTAAEQNNFILHANNLSNNFFEFPWLNYLSYFNVFAIKVISTQSGTKHPNTLSDCSSASPLVPVSNPTTYLDCSFDTYGVHDFVVPSNISNLVNVLATNFPYYDLVFIIANTTYFGYGGHLEGYLTTTVNTSGYELLGHSVGHSLGGLADEYYAGDDWAAEKPNMTQQTNPSLVKWKNWMGYNGVGIYQHCCGGNSDLWYKPHNACKMRYYNLTYCAVCKEAIIENIHAWVNPIVSYIPTSSSINSTNQFIDFKLTELIKPIPNTLNIVWKLDGVTVLNNIDSIQIDQNALTNSTHTLTVTVVDTTTLVRVDNHSTIHFSTVTWIIDKTNTGIRLTSTDNRITCSVFPNPSSDVLNISVEFEKKSKLSIQIVSLQGKIIQQVTNETLVDGKYLNTVNTEHWPNGTYVIVFKFGDTTHTQTFIKQ